MMNLALKTVLEEETGQFCTLMHEGGDMEVKMQP